MLASAIIYRAGYNGSMKYAMLLRGINVGGQQRVEMSQLRVLLGSLGYQDVATYINSGNVVFSSAIVPDEHTIAAAIRQEFGFDVPMLILDATQITSVAKAIPREWTNDYTDWKADVVYLFDEVNSPAIIEKIHPRPEFEEMKYVDHALLCRIERKYQPKSSLVKIIGTDLYKYMTIRNVTTARKLAEMVR